MLLHGLEQCRLGLGRRAVDLIREHHVAEQRSRGERPAPSPGGFIVFDDVGAGDVRGHQIGRELDAAEQQAQSLRDGAHHQRLGGTGETGDQAVATHQQRGQDLVESLVLADDHLADLRQDLARTALNRSTRVASAVASRLEISVCVMRILFAGY